MATKVPKIVTIEGIIASGKTTLLSKLQSQLPNHKMKIVAEPIAAWENTTKFKPIPQHFVNSNKLFKQRNDGIINGDNSKQEQFELLSQMYRDSHRWCFSFQLWALYTRIKSIESTMNECIASNEDIDILLIERSSMANRIFASIMYDNDYLNECEWLMYNHFFDYFNEKCKYLLDAIIYLNCPVHIAMERVNIRNRKGESYITNEYQSALQNKHNEWLLNKHNDNIQQIPLMDVGIPYDNDTNIEKQTFENIESFIKDIQPRNNIILSNDTNEIDTVFEKMQQQIHKL